MRFASKAAAAAAVLGFLVTLGRVPTLWPDSQLYASIARSRQLYGVGIPSATWFSPAAVDHLPFYGPVYFDLVAWSFALFGVSLESFRIVCVLGAVAAAAAAAALAKLTSGDPDRPWWAFALVLFTPEIGVAATSGTMEPIALAFELGALAVFVRGLVRGRHPLAHGAAAGVCLLCAALTTPRTYPFVCVFLAAGVWLAAARRHERAFIWVQLAAAASLLVAGLSAWAVWTQGSPARWAHYIFFILSREDTDVALLSTARRHWAFNWSSCVTPLFALAGAVLAAPRLARAAREAREHAAAAFVLATAATAGVLTFVGMNITFTLGMYFALPLFAGVLALPRDVVAVDRRAIAAGLLALIACDAAIAALKYVRVAATWAARDSAPVAALVGRHVPPGSAVIGPDALYFFAVEGSGSRYRSTSIESLADWARWVPLFDPRAADLARRIPQPEPAARFLIWPAADDLPAGYACAASGMVETYTPAAHHLAVLGPLGRVWDVGYPATTLYRFQPGCPLGYDPTKPVILGKDATK